VFAERRQRFLEAMGSDAVALVIGAGVQKRSADTEYPFRQDSDFWYLTGFDHPDACAVLRTDGGPPYTLFVQPRDRSAETWTGYRPGVEGARDDYGADEAYCSSELMLKLPEILERAKQIHHVLGRRADLDQKLVAIQEELRARTKTGHGPATGILDPRSITHEMRLRKEPAELELMRRAADISREAHREAARLAQPGRYEYELEAALQHVFRRRGGRGPAYPPIVGSGRNAAILHYVTNDQPLAEGQLVLIDAGVELAGYASDVTRTYPVAGRFEGAGRAVYEIVLAAQQAALEKCRPGGSLPEIHDAALRVLVEGMISLGLLKGGVDDAIAEKTYQPYYMHGTSHWLGLDVHDVGIYATRSGDREVPRELEPGMVFTVEPGLYVREDDSAAPDDLRGLGVRIEDDVVTTDDGYENLNAAIPKSIQDVEAWVRESG
jgi:Xaa-Pro aminopeptidase